ncbi:uncharacterized protein LOC111899458 [Lactuca sativa]|uniref:uncharacterized protein LOC111899458 n=1 Tax=Lactuca sativa TaxID=4236 RepID=UPI000CD8026C|nr:uncharacterized protein LOC111899458 [Lactuca sativa]
MKKKNPALSKSKVSSNSQKQKIKKISNLNSPMISQTKTFQKTFFKRQSTNNSFHKPTNVIDKFPSTKHKSDINQKVENVRKVVNLQNFKTTHNLVNVRKSDNLRKSTHSQTNVKFTPEKTNFPNPLVHKATKVSYSEGTLDVQSINHWFEGQGKKFQLGKFSQQHIKNAYEEYLNESSTGNLSSQELNIPVQRWQPINKATRIEKSEVKSNESPKLSKNYVSISLTNAVGLIDSVKTKVRTWALSSKFHSLFQANNQGTKKPWSKRYGDMFTLDIKPIVGKPSVCLLSKATNDVSWLWHRRLSHLNFRNLNKLVAEDLVRGLPVLKFDNDTLCATCEQGKQHCKGHPMVIDSKIVEPLQILHIDLCGTSTV